MESVKNNIKLLRVKMGLSQEALATEMHVHQTAVSQWENGRANPDTQTAKNLAAFFDVTIDYLLGQSEESGVYYANNINGSNVVQGSGSVTLGCEDFINKEESEILRIYRDLDVRNRTKLMNFIFKLEEDSKAENAK